MPKVIRSDVRKIILKVKEFFVQEKENGGPIFPFQKVHERVSAATGISLHTVSNIVKEGKSNQVVTPGKNRKTRKDKFIMDSFDQGVLRRKIHEYYSLKKEIPTLRKLHQDLKEEIDFKGSREIIKRNVKMIGFNYKKTKSNRKVLMERNDISAWRARYLQAVKRNEEIEKLPIVYLDETYIHTGITTGKCWQDDKTDGVLEPVSKGQRFIIVHAGGEKGFVQNAELIFKSQTKSGDYHDDMNHVNLKKWVTEKLAPNLEEPSLIIMDNAPYHNTCQSKVPNTNSNKGEIMEWLREKSIEFSPEMTRPQLLEMVKRNKPEPLYAVDDILKRLGHKVLRLPPYHCDLNPIEMVWASMKRKVAEVNIGKPPNAIPEMVKNAFEAITPSEWKNHCTHVKKIEEEYRHKDGHLDKPFIIPVFSDSEESSDEDDEDEISENYMEGVCPLDVVKIDHNYNKMI